MQTLPYLVIASIVCIAAAQHMAAVRGRSRQGWMMAAALFGPLPLIPLALLGRR